MVGLTKLGIELEGEYTTWALVWKKDYGINVQLNEVTVDNDGTVHAEEVSRERGYTRTYGGTETNLTDYIHFLWQRISSQSATGKYYLGVPTVLYRQFQVWKDGVRIFIRDIQDDEAEARNLILCSMSPNGRFVAVIAEDDTTFDDQWLFLYEGS